jgi:hypothetical protein
MRYLTFNSYNPLCTGKIALITSVNESKFAIHGLHITSVVETTISPTKKI